MHKIINILFFISLLNTSIVANITEEKVKEYLHVSRGKILIKLMFTSAYKTYFPIIYGKDIKSSNEDMIKQYTKFIFNPKYEDDLLEILRQLDEKTYSGIMAFYETKVGKKYTQAFERLYTNDLDEQLLIFLKQPKKQPFSKNKIKLILEINKALNYITLQVNLKKVSFISYTMKGIKKDKITSIEKVDSIVKKYKNKLKENLGIIRLMTYKNFNEEELSQVLKYAQTYGKIEMEFVFRALTLYIQNFYKDLYELIEKRKKAESNLNTTHK